SLASKSLSKYDHQQDKATVDVHRVMYKAIANSVSIYIDAQFGRYTYTSVGFCVARSWVMGNARRLE
ncbi:MAG: hypothetical protein IJ551_01485, partial [Prevotella sp.]|nr:hypothetical protein [Prevotella sp.]